MIAKRNAENEQLLKEQFAELWAVLFPAEPAHPWGSARPLKRAFVEGEGCGAQ